MFCYEIGECPRCGSRMTGRLKQGKEGQKYFMMGSPVIYASDPGVYNCACALCGIQWVGSGKMVKRSMAEIREKQNEWNESVDDRPEFTRDEENKIADELYRGVSDEDPNVVKDEKNDGIFKKLLLGAIKQTNRQGQTLADDLFGMTNAGYYSWKDEIEHPSDEFGADDFLEDADAEGPNY